MINLKVNDKELFGRSILLDLAIIMLYTVIICPLLILFVIISPLLILIASLLKGYLPNNNGN